MTAPKPTFDWLIYSDATLAGLAVLIPLPPIDLILESYFRRRNIRTIAQRREIEISDEVVKVINRRQSFSCWGCLTWPISVGWYFAKRISRKILYFWTIKESSDQLSYYWHRAYLLDYMLQVGHLRSVADAQVAQLAMEQALTDTKTSPLHKLTDRIIYNIRRQFRFYKLVFQRRSWRFVVDESLNQLKDDWNDAANYLAELSVRYNTLFDEFRTQEAIRIGPTSSVVADGGSDAEHHEEQETNQTIQEKPETDSNPEAAKTAAPDHPKAPPAEGE